MEFQLFHSGGEWSAVMDRVRAFGMQEDIFVGRDMLQELAFFLACSPDSASCTVHSRGAVILTRCC